MPQNSENLIAGMEAKSSQVDIRPYKSLEEARNVREDWTGKTSTKERRKLQNRLHQRAWRRRKIVENNLQSGAHNITCQPLEQPDNPELTSAFAKATAAFEQRSQIITKSLATPYVPTRTSYQTSYPDINSAVASDVCAVSQDAIRRAIGYTLHQSNAERKPKDSLGPFFFPISLDHRLITLIQFNVLRGLLTNMHLTANLQSVPTECQAALSIVLPTPSTPPPIFSRTHVQRTVPHPYWMDAVFCPTLRNNLIIAVATADPRYSEDDICDDMCGGLYDGYDDCEKRGMMVWGEPWMIESWEITEAFARKWAWLLRGCKDMIKATNDWRDLRGEERLIVEIDDIE